VQVNKRILTLAIAAIVALVVAVPGAALAEPGPDAKPAAEKKKKKKCGKKKKGKKGVAAAKGCKKKKPAPIVLPAPLVRGSVSWTQVGFDIDLHAFDANGAHSGLVHPPAPPSVLVQGIPNATHSGDVQTAGSETFTDNLFLANAPATREFAYVLCFYDNGSTATFTGVTKTGASTSIPVSRDEGDAVVFTIPGGPTGPAENPC
jgi:hypothetical protein